MHGYPVNPGNDSKATPFMWACADGELECMKYLLTKGAKTTERTVGGWVPLHYAMSHDQVKVAEFLLNDPRVSVDVATKQGLTPLAITFEHDFAACCSLLIDRGCDLCPAPVHQGRSFGHHGRYYRHDYSEEDENESHIVLRALSQGATNILKMLLGKPQVMATFQEYEFKSIKEGPKNDLN
jgi:ankyrin repeat protein